MTTRRRTAPVTVDVASLRIMAEASRRSCPHTPKLQEGVQGLCTCDVAVFLDSIVALARPHEHVLCLIVDAEDKL